MLTTNDTALVIVDVQGKLAQIMDNKETLFKSLETVVKGAKILDIPIIWVEQIPHKLGPTIPQISDHLHDHSPIAKNSFSCYREPKFVDAWQHQVVRMSLSSVSKPISAYTKQFANY